MKHLKLTKQPATNGCKIFLGDEHVKTVPERYAQVLKKRHLLNYTKKRLTQEERFMLEVELFELQHLRIPSQKWIYNLVKRSAAKGIRKIQMHNGNSYYELIYKNGQALKAPQHLYDLGINRLPALKRNY